MQGHGPGQVATVREDHGLVAQRDLQPGLVAQFAADPLLLLVQGHGPGQVATVIEDHGLIAQRRRELGLVAQSAADPLRVLVQGHGPGQVATLPEDHGLVVQRSLQPGLVAQLPADPLLFLVQGHGPGQVVTVREDHGLVAQRAVQPGLVAQFAADPFLLLVRGHGSVQVATGIEDQGLVAQRPREPGLIAQFAAGPLLLLVQGHGSVQVATGIEDQGLAAQRTREPSFVAQLAADPFLLLVQGHSLVQVAAVPEDHGLVAQHRCQSPPIPDSPVVLHEMPLERQGLHRMTCGVEKYGDVPDVIGVPIRPVQYSPVGVGQTELRRGFHLRPVDLDPELVGSPGLLEEGQVGQQVVQPPPGVGLGQLPGQFVGAPRTEVAGFEVVGQAKMGLVPGGPGGKIPMLDSLTQIVVEEADETAAAHQGLLRSQVQRRPTGSGQRLAICAQQIEQLRLGQAAPGRPEESHGVADQSRAIALVVLFVPLEDCFVQGRDRVGLEVPVDLVVQTLVLAKHTQLL